MDDPCGCLDERRTTAPGYAWVPVEGPLGARGPVVLGEVVVVGALVLVYTGSGPDPWLPG